jgi:hypothetical protein
MDAQQSGMDLISSQVSVSCTVGDAGKRRL